MPELLNRHYHAQAGKSALEKRGNLELFRDYELAQTRFHRDRSLFFYNIFTKIGMAYSCNTPTFRHSFFEPISLLFEL